MIQAGQTIQHRIDGNRYRVERLTACFAVLTRLPDGKPGGFGRVRLSQLEAMGRVVSADAKSEQETS